MWTFDQLRLVLPAGFEHRAAGIARRVAEELAGMPAPADLSLRSLSLPPLEIRAGASDRQIAGQIARSIAVSAGVAGVAGVPVAGPRP
jgi:hypothetical protein